MALALNVRHVLTWPFGILQAAQFIIGIITLICVAATITAEGMGFVWFVAVSSLVCALVFLVLYILNLPATVTFLPWVLVELISTAVWALFYFIAFCVAAGASAKYARVTGTNLHSAAGAASFFCLLGLIACAFEAFLLFRTWRSGGGGISVTTHTTTTTTTNEVRY